MKHANIAFFIPHIGCPHCCSFCNQNTISGASEPVSAEQVSNTLKSAAAGDRSNTEIAFFGGSFTAIDRSYMISLLEAAYPYTVDRFSGIRISTRPDAIDEDILNVLKKYNVTSIELGVQSLSDEVLNANERGHTAADVYAACKMIKEYGFSLGLQMMTGLYKDSEQTINYTADEFVRIAPDTVRVYPTVVLKGTKLAELYKQGVYEPMSFEKTVDICAKLIILFKENNIKLIRLGLHASEDVSQNMIAGVYHPAFKEICESRIFLNYFKLMLRNYPKGRYVVLIPPRSYSKAAGQKKHNIDELSKIGYNIILEENNALSGYSAALKEV